MHSQSHWTPESSCCFWWLLLQWAFSAKETLTTHGWDWSSWCRYLHQNPRIHLWRKNECISGLKSVVEVRRIVNTSCVWLTLRSSIRMFVMDGLFAAFDTGWVAECEFWFSKPGLFGGVMSCWPTLKFSWSCPPVSTSRYKHFWISVSGRYIITSVFVGNLRSAIIDSLILRIMIIWRNLLTWSRKMESTFPSPRQKASLKCAPVSSRNTSGYNQFNNDHVSQRSFWMGVLKNDEHFWLTQIVRLPLRYLPC